MNTSRLNTTTHPLTLSQTHAISFTHTHTHSLPNSMTVHAYVPTMSASVRGLGPSLLLGGLFRKYTDVPSADAVTMAKRGEGLEEERRER